MIIATKDLKEFLKLSKPIKQNGIIPILSYIKLESEDGAIVLSRTNLASYCLHRIEGEYKAGICILLDETKLSALVNNTSDPILSIKENKKTIEIADDTSKVSFQKEDISTYPIFPTGDGSIHLIDAEVIDAIGIAKNYITEMEVPTQWSYVFVLPGEENSIIYGAELSGFYLKKFDQILPYMCLNKEASSLISMFDNANYYTAGNYDFFTDGKTTFGFIKNEYTPLPVRRLLDRTASESRSIVFKNDILKFCDTAIGISNNLFAPVRMNSHDAGLMFTYGNEGSNSEMIADIPAENFGNLPEIGLGIKTLSKCLRALPYERVIIRNQEDVGFNGLILTNQEDLGYYGIIMGLK